MERPRLSVALLAVADAVLVVAGVLVAITRAGSDRVPFLPAGSGDRPAPAPAAPPPVTAADVVGRPAPEPVTATSAWEATLEGRGERLRLYAPVVAVGGLRHTTVRVTSPDPRPRTAPDGAVHHPAGTAIALPDGTRWYPLAPFRLDGRGDVPLSSPATGGGRLTGRASFAGMVAGGGVQASGRFATRDGRVATTLRLPAGARIWADCPADDGAAVPPPCPEPQESVEVAVGATGMRVEIDRSRQPGYDGNGEGGVEVEVAGEVRARALGREWTGLVGSLEADDLTGTVVWDGAAWRVEVAAGSARQVWIDVWPVVGTVLEASSGYDRGLHTCVRNCRVRLRYRNVGHATAQIFEAEAVGGVDAVALGLNATRTHDAGLGVHRGGHEVNLRGGRGVDSHVPPGGASDRGLSHTPGVPVTLVLRGNFDEVRVPLAIPPEPADPRR